MVVIVVDRPVVVVAAVLIVGVVTVLSPVAGTAGVGLFTFSLTPPVKDEKNPVMLLAADGVVANGVVANGVIPPPPPIGV